MKAGKRKETKEGRTKERMNETRKASSNVNAVYSAKIQFSLYCLKGAIIHQSAANIILEVGPNHVVLWDIFDYFSGVSLSFSSSHHQPA